LNYTRRSVGDGHISPPKGRMFPSPSGLGSTGLSRDRPPRGSQHPFGVGRSFHPLSLPLQEGLRIFRDPLPAQVPAVLANYLVPLSEHPYGLTLFRINSTSQEDPAISPVVFDVSVSLPRRENTHHVPFWAKPVSRFGLFELDDVYQRFSYLDLLPQPSASTGLRLPVSHCSLTGSVYPVRWLHCQYA